MDSNWWKGRDVFLTGHTGFKGAWLCVMLSQLGAKVHGFALPTGSDFLFHRAGLSGLVVTHTLGDIRDAHAVRRALAQSTAGVVLHLAAQTVVRQSYEDPRESFTTNVVGTFEVLEAVRRASFVERCVVVTTDKVYRNHEWDWGYREADELGGDDPYSASKACAELVAHSMAASFPRVGLAVATARAGNVIGGGDTTSEALMPELIKAFSAGRPAVLRRPAAIRPWQSVLEPLAGYLTLAERLTDAIDDTSWNFGPSSESVATVAEVATKAARIWGGNVGWEAGKEAGPHEAGVLTLDSTRSRTHLGWAPITNLDDALRATIEFEKQTRSGADVRETMESQVANFLAGSTKGMEQK